MPYATEHTQWPEEATHANVQHLVSLVYQLIDDKSEDAGTRLANEVFTNDAQVMLPTGVYHGYEGMLHFSMHP